MDNSESDVFSDLFSQSSLHNPQQAYNDSSFSSFSEGGNTLYTIEDSFLQQNDPQYGTPFKATRGRGRGRGRGARGLNATIRHTRASRGRRGRGARRGSIYADVQGNSSYFFDPSSSTIEPPTQYAFF